MNDGILGNRDVTCVNVWPPEFWSVPDLVMMMNDGDDDEWSLHYGGGDVYYIDHFDEDEDVGCMFVMMMNVGKQVWIYN